MHQGFLYFQLAVNALLQREIPHFKFGGRRERKKTTFFSVFLNFDLAST